MAVHPYGETGECGQSKKWIRVYQANDGYHHVSLPQRGEMLVCDNEADELWTLLPAVLLLGQGGAVEEYGVLSEAHYRDGEEDMESAGKWDDQVICKARNEEH